MANSAIDIDLNALNSLNLNTAGKICFVIENETNEVKPLYAVEEFNPETQSLILEQIWTYPQEILVRIFLEHLTIDKQNNLEEIVKYQEILIEWLSSNSDYDDGILND
jgi:hypothetical protein